MPRVSLAALESSTPRRGRPAMGPSASTSRKSRLGRSHRDEIDLASSPTPSASGGAAAHRHTSPPTASKARRGRPPVHATPNAVGARGRVAVSSPDPLALSISPQAPKRGRKRKSGALDHDEGMQVLRDGDGNGVAGAADLNGEGAGNGEGTGAEGADGEGKKDGFTDEEKQEMWADFAAERYEVVEQLPLELHRNFRLLRELDDGCIAQCDRLQQQIRAYISARFELVKRTGAVAEALVLMEEEAGLAPTGPDGEAPEGGLSASVEAQAGEASVANGSAVAEDTPKGAGARDAQTDNPSNVDLPASSPVPVEGQSPARPNGTVSNESGLNQPRHKIGAGAIEAEHSANDSAQQQEAAQSAGSPVAEAEADHTDIADIDDALGQTTQTGEQAATAEAVETNLKVSAGAETVEERNEDNAAKRNSAPAIDRLGEEQQGSAGAVTRPDSAEPADGGEDTGAVGVQTPDVRSRPARFLPEISRLAREIVRNCEEKVAVAQGAYDAIDRHIRALDSQLSAQETSLILGLRPDTLPSAGADAAAAAGGEVYGADGQPIAGGAGLGQATGYGHDDADGEGLTLDTGGGRRREPKKGRGRKKGRPGDATALKMEGAAAVAGPAGLAAALGPGMEYADLRFDVADEDPNEPRYCYCNYVAFGEMVACDNEDCVIEWFHLPCAGLAVQPKGQWYCNVCKPKPGWAAPGQLMMETQAAAKAAAAAGLGDGAAEAGVSKVGRHQKKKPRRR